MPNESYWLDSLASLCGGTKINDDPLIFNFGERYQYDAFATAFEHQVHKVDYYLHTWNYECTTRVKFHGRPRHISEFVPSGKSSKGIRKLKDENVAPSREAWESRTKEYITPPRNHPDFLGVLAELWDERAVTTTLVVNETFNLIPPTTNDLDCIIYEYFRDYAYANVEFNFKPFKRAAKRWLINKGRVP